MAYIHPRVRILECFHIIRAVKVFWLEFQKLHEVGLGHPKLPEVSLEPGLGPHNASIGGKEVHHVSVNPFNPVCVSLEKPGKGEPPFWFRIPPPFKGQPIPDKSDLLLTELIIGSLRIEVSPDSQHFLESIPPILDELSNRIAEEHLPLLIVIEGPAQR